MKKWWVYILFQWLCISLLGQVSLISGSYSVATASGSGVSGIPSLSYTPSAGTDRLLLFFMAVERDHKPNPRGDNWASGAPTGGSVPTVEISSTTLSHLSSTWYYIYEVSDATTNAVISIELMVYGTLEANIPSGTNTFNVTANYSTPASAGDEAVFGAMMFENVGGMSHIVNSSCESCNSISTSNINATDGNNAVFSITALGSDRTITAGSGFTSVGSSSVSNSNGTYTDASFSEQDGMAVGAQYITSNIENQTSPFTFSGSADIFGVVESAFRITSVTPLPVELIQFDVQQTNNGNLLTWITASEINNDYFDVQRSQDGIVWESIGKVQGMGNSSISNTYYFEDITANCTTCYYRLNQIDFDLSSSFSNMISIYNNVKNRIDVNVFGNQLNVTANSEVNQIELYDLNGKRVFQQIEINSRQLNIILNNLKSGVYIVRVISNTGSLNKKIIIN